MRYPELRDRLLPEAMDLFNRMASAHLASDGDRFFILAVAGSGADLIFTGKAPFAGEKIDPGTLDDLASHRLLRKGYGRRDPNYRVTGEGILFHQWLMQEKGGPVAQVDAEVRKLVEGDAFAASHLSASHHMSEAFTLLWSGDTGEAVLSELGDHLRKAIFDLVDDVLPDQAEESSRREQPVSRLKDWVDGRQDIGERERTVLVALVDLLDTVLRLDNRLAHARDEADLDRPINEWSEARRAAFLTAVLCYELHTIQG